MCVSCVVYVACVRKYLQRHLFFIFPPHVRLTRYQGQGTTSPGSHTTLRKRLTLRPCSGVCAGWGAASGLWGDPTMRAPCFRHAGRILNRLHRPALFQAPLTRSTASPWPRCRLRARSAAHPKRRAARTLPTRASARPGTPAPTPAARDSGELQAKVSHTP